MKSKQRLVNGKRLFALCVFCLLLSFPVETEYSGLGENKTQTTPEKSKKSKYFRYQAKKSPSAPEEAKKTFWPMPEVEVIDFDEYVQRAENLCGDYDRSMADIEASAGNAETAILICLEDDDYMCAYRIAKKYKDSLPRKSEYDPYNIVRKAEEIGWVPLDWLASAYEELKILDKAEEIYKDTADRWGSYYNLLDFYLRQNFFAAARKLVDDESVRIGNSYLLLAVADKGKLKEIGLYDKFLSSCRREPTPGCLSYIDSGDISKDMLEKAWNSGIGDQYPDGEYVSSYDLAIIAKLALDSGLSGSYADFLRERTVKKFDTDAYFSFGDMSAALLLGWENDILSRLGEDIPNVYAQLGEVAFEQGDYEKVYKFLEQSDTFGVSYGIALASRNGDTEAARKFARLLLEGNDKVISLKGTGSIAEGDAYIALGDWKEAMANCEWGMGTDDFAPYESCQCAVEVVQGLQKEMKEGE
ncbi:MAG: hypothetical protein A2224_02135 [Candidatus Magasanikbacteria bacterium RIFOXYA2_FULL_40_20]|nr:MAG: hypothetical protein A2224_02135 [Candidatus Magasanikbacteria bacterium RIFOXYA2_FULL_40_20]